MLASLAADRERVAEIETQLRELERSIRFLEHEKAFLEARLDAYTYPVLALPAEIISEVFNHFLPVYPQRSATTGLLSPLILSQICRQWRVIAISTPALWRAVMVDLRTGRENRVDTELHLLKTSLSRSGSCPLSIALESAPTVKLEPFLEAISAHRARWEYLKLDTCFTYLTSIKGPLPTLRSLTLALFNPQVVEQNERISSVFLTASRLRKVALLNYGVMYRTILPWAQLTVLIVEVMPHDECVTVLNLAPNLVHCMLKIFVGAQQSGFGQTIAQLVHLNTLVLQSVLAGSAVADILDTLTLPALRKLQLSAEFLGTNSIATLSALISRSACTIQRMHIVRRSALHQHSARQYELCKQAWPTVALSWGPQLGRGQFWDDDAFDF
ncbi:F-box domain-containing protein [Mycena venus]|uniref:F-box domain-containing protein n=1 Tax=Mycena venus TaxID=2733690 RepID=A0A8H7CPS2_9AGAR|nr:F-box domain-containing protein [Mycena venus]